MRLVKGDIIKSEGSYYIVESSTSTHAFVKRIEHGKVMRSRHRIRVAKSKSTLLKKICARVNSEEIEKILENRGVFEYKHALTKQWDLIRDKEAEIICIYCQETLEYAYYHLGTICKTALQNKKGEYDLFIKLTGLSRL